MTHGRYVLLNPILLCAAALMLSACGGGGPRGVAGEAADGGATDSTAGVLCDASESYTGNYSAAGVMTAVWEWTCDETTRYLTSNGLPNHAVGTFPNSGNGNTISKQKINFSAPLKPVMGTLNTYIGGPGGAGVHALNGVKFDPGTGGTCPNVPESTSECHLGENVGPWQIEALGQDVFDFGEDDNNAHVQPGGEYHYHGMPEGLMTALGVSESEPQMVLIGWAADGYPVYGRYCYSEAMDARSPVKVCSASFAKKAAPEPGRPSLDLVPMGAFVQDWKYETGSGDLDDCNGRTGVTPEFPEGIYYYMASDSYPYFSRCLKGEVTR